ncbi:UDP-N-acetylglucosamine--LPS N-acetylglucosamine transferase [Calothrix sp. 336/3]|uniref:UDP-N-acetylglucosamine--LPS N-acetylglucosamine transferase n=1 Tax=Calothrix sp. 336/3 TaxID=1337936 RepID=UPI000A5EDA6E|nr:UDP-N-acetylglucosamine--LPS N-acetylglucosamine transferase [Calothrix sp. 336/3]
MLVCSSGGHFKALYQLQNFWASYNRHWITFKTPTTELMLAEENKIWAWSPTNRHIPNLMRNLFLAWKVIRTERPDVIITSGAGVAVPFLIIGKLSGCQTVFVESITRVHNLSLSAKIALPFLNVIYVHWLPLQQRYRKAKMIVQ